MSFTFINATKADFSNKWTEWTDYKIYCCHLQYSGLALLHLLCRPLSPYIHLSFGRWCTDGSLLDTSSSGGLWELVKLLGWLNKLSVKMLSVSSLKTRGFSVRDEVFEYVFWSCLFFPVGSDIIKAMTAGFAFIQYFKVISNTADTKEVFLSFFSAKVSLFMILFS